MSYKSLHQVSDTMLCTPEEYLNYKSKYQNDLFTAYRMTNTRKEKGSFGLSFDVMDFNKDLLCSSVINNRASNNVKYNIYEQQTPFLLKYCSKPTHDNHIICSKNKCCSTSHQLFGNITKSRGG